MLQTKKKLRPSFIRASPKTKKRAMNESRNKGFISIEKVKTSIDEGTFAVFNRFRDKSKLPSSNGRKKDLRWLTNWLKMEKLKKLENY